MPKLRSRWIQFRNALSKRSSNADRSSARALPYDVLVFPIIDWNYRFQRPQQLSLEFARRGHRVFYFSTHFHCAAGIRDPEATEVAENVFHLTLPGSYDPPDIYRDLPTEGQISAMTFGVQCVREKFEIGAALCLVEYPFWSPLVKGLNNVVVFYDCMDEYTTFPNSGPPVFLLEPEILREADAILCASPKLQQDVRDRTGRSSVLIRNAVNPQHFATPPSKLALPADGRTVGYHGAIATWTDVDLLTYAARELPDKRFVLIGEVQAVDVSELRALPNVMLLGEVSHARLPEYVHAFDVCLLP